VLYDAEGREALTVMAARLLWNHRTGTLELSGDVQGTSPDGLRFSTERVRWDEATQTLQGDGPVKIERDDLQLAGEDFEFHLKDGTLIVLNAHLQLFFERQGGED
jgi:LPS export ABC transporter protein LptC